MWRCSYTAEEAFKEITDPEIEYRNSVRKAVGDLGRRVKENADRARDAAEALQQEISEQIDDIEGRIDDLEKTLAGEAYYRLLAYERFGVTADIQYMRDRAGAGDSPEGFIFGIRTDTRF